MINIYRRVNNLKKRWGTNDPFKLCKYLKIEVRYYDLGEIKGYYKKVFNRKFIVINENLSSLDKKIICAHELGHCLLHSSKDIQNLLEYGNFAKYSIFEDEANEFAAYLLIDSTFDEWCKSCIKSELLEELKYYSRYKLR